MSERWFQGLRMEMKFRTHEAVVMRLSDGVMVRTRSMQRQERDVTMEMLNKMVACRGIPQEWFDIDLTATTRVNPSLRVRFQAKMD